MNRRNYRQLCVESLESRQCFSVDLGMVDPVSETGSVEVLRHNHNQPTDVNVDGFTSALDALAIINELNRPGEDIYSAMMSDTNGDRSVSPMDALIVINRLNNPPDDLQGSNSLVRSTQEADPLNLDIPESPAQDAELVDLRDPDLAPSESPDTSTSVSETTFDPTDDNGNGFFLSEEDAAAVADSIKAELLMQLQMDDPTRIQVAVFTGGSETVSGTWRYLSEEGLSLWGNWRRSPGELRLFLSNVEEENRIYGQHPNSSFVFFSWLEDQPVGYYFTPLNSLAVEDPVPIERYIAYFDGVPGAEASGLAEGEFPAFSGNFTTFAGLQPLETLLRDLYAIQRKWDDELGTNNS